MIWISTLVVVLSVILDQITKIIAESSLKGTDGIVVIPKVLSFSYLENRGAAFGIFSDNRWVFMIFSTIAILVMIYLIFSMRKKHPIFLISLSMLVGGGIGNMIDRIFRGYVIDFFKVLFVDFAVFNVADCFVTVGAIILAIYMMFIYKEPADKKEQVGLSENHISDENADDAIRENYKNTNIKEPKDNNEQGE